jgi:N-acetylglutamate synthase-like GNAT family acetyltransferase
MRELGQVVGAVGLQSADGAGLLRSLVVLPSLHRQGRGAALVSASSGCRAAWQDDLYFSTTVPGFFALLDYLRLTGRPCRWLCSELPSSHRFVRRQRCACTSGCDRTDTSRSSLSLDFSTGLRRRP